MQGGSKYDEVESLEARVPKEFYLSEGISISTAFPYDHHTHGSPSHWVRHLVDQWICDLSSEEINQFYRFQMRSDEELPGDWIKRKKILWYNVCVANLQALRQLLFSAKTILLREIRGNMRDDEKVSDNINLDRALAMLTFDWVPRWIAVRLQQEVSKQNNNGGHVLPKYKLAESQSIAKFHAKNSVYRERFMRRFKATPIASSSIVENWHTCSPRKRNTKRERINTTNKNNELDSNYIDYTLDENSEPSKRSAVEVSPGECNEPNDNNCVPDSPSKMYNVFLTFKPEMIDDREWSLDQLKRLCATLGLSTDGSREDLITKIGAIHNDTSLLLRSFTSLSIDDDDDEPSSTTHQGILNEGDERSNNLLTNNNMIQNCDNVVSSATRNHTNNNTIPPSVTPGSSNLKRKKKLVFSPFVQMKTIPCRDGGDGDHQDENNTVIPPTA